MFIRRVLALRTSISGDEGRHDVSANGVWGDVFEKAFFDVREFIFCSKSILPSVYMKHQVEKSDAMSNVSENLNKVHSHILIFFVQGRHWQICYYVLQ